jgi:glycosyltransferase involved in cell wall biosynthesis
MKATVSTIGRFHAFNLVQQLQQRGYLHSFISTYPTWAVARYGKYGIDAALYRSIWRLGIIARLWPRIPNIIRRDRNLQLWFHEHFDKAARNFISPESDLFVGWSSLCLHSLEKAKELGAVTVVDRGNSHMQYFMDILQEEYELWGLKYSATHPGVCERELQEYIEADWIAIPSLFTKRTFLEQGIPENKLIHVPYGVSLEEFYPVPREDNTFRVIYCGGLTLRKGLQYLLRAFYELNLPDAELWLVGSLTPEIQPFLSKYESEKIILKGTHPQNQLRWFYSQCSVFCLASIEDGFGMVIPQAMGCGLPVIHTTNTGGSDIVRDGVDGFCVPIRDVDALKEKILFFYENPGKRVEIGNNSLAQARKSLSWDDYGQKITTAYQAALNQKRYQFNYEKEPLSKSI